MPRSMQKLHEIRAVPPPIWNEPTLSDYVDLSIQLDVITPMYGGGPDAGEVDEITPIRASSIRGNLRFWWRTLCGPHCTDVQKLFERESELWGSTASGGKVSVRTELKSAGVNCGIDRGNAANGPMGAYFQFPFQAQQKLGIKEKPGRQGVSFVLHIRCTKDNYNEVCAALRAWIAFGGVGARTRRALGALQAVDADANNWRIPAEPGSRTQWFQDLFEPFRPRTAVGDVPGFATLNNAVFLAGNAADPIHTWNSLGKFWARFRKGHIGGEEYIPMNGSYWSDYDVLGVFQSSDSYISLSKPALGLPIIYQKFAGGGFDGEVHAEAGTRFASPVILKPAAFADGTIRPLCLVLFSSGTPERVKINGTIVDLHVPGPGEEQVLNNLRAINPLDAVVKSFEQEFDCEREVIAI